MSSFALDDQSWSLGQIEAGGAAGQSPRGRHDAIVNNRPDGG